MLCPHLSPQSEKKNFSKFLDFCPLRFCPLNAPLKKFWCLHWCLHFTPYSPHFKYKKMQKSAIFGKFWDLCLLRNTLWTPPHALAQEKKSGDTTGKRTVYIGRFLELSNGLWLKTNQLECIIFGTSCQHTCGLWIVLFLTLKHSPWDLFVGDRRDFNLNKAVLEPRVSPAFAITFFCNHCNILDLKIHQSMWIHWPFFPRIWTKGHWPLDYLWPHVCWGHMCDSTQGSLCPSPMTIHQCIWIQWSILQITTYIHIHTYTYILHTEWVIT